METQLEELEKIKLGVVAGARYTLTAYICLAIKQELAYPGLKLLGERFNWPSIIDFESLSDRIFYDLKPELLELTQSHIVLGTSQIWTRFSETLNEADMSLIKFSRSRDLEKFDIAGKMKHAG